MKHRNLSFIIGLSIIFIFYLMFPQNMLAQDVKGENCAEVSSANSLTTSPFDPPEVNDEVFVINDGPFLDTGCSFRNEGPLIIELKVTRYVGAVDNNGYLEDPDFLIGQGLIPEKLRIEMPAYDVDYYADVTGFEPERDRVSFNGQEVGYLIGENNTWIYNGFDIDIRDVKFPKYEESGSITPAVNEIRIDIDVANEGVGEYWCTAIDWVALRTLRAWRPVLLVHGFLFGEPGMWENLWEPKLNDLRIENMAIKVGKVSSIEHNSKIIAEEVEKMRTRYGVDKIIITSHSKGGLDSRDYIRNHNDIADLIMLGTPNGGSPLANYTQGVAILLDIFTEIPVSLILNFLVPGLEELSPSYMELFNKSTGQNPNTDYITMAGNYLPEIYGNPFLPGYDDMIVTVSSVHELSYAENGEHPDDGFYSSHFGLYKSDAIYTRLLPHIIPTMASSVSSYLTLNSSNNQELILASASNDISSFLKHSSVNSEQGLNSFAAVQAEKLLPHTQSTVDVIKNGEVETKTINVDAAARGALQVLWGEGDLDLVVIDPNGKRIDRAEASVNPDISFYAYEEIEGLRYEGYMIDNPIAGDWQFEVKGINILSTDGEGYGAVAFLENSAINMLFSTDADFYRNSEQVVLQATLTENSAPLTNAVVSASVRLPDESIEELSFYDDGTHGDDTAGDGVYKCIFTNTSLGGIYNVVVQAERTAAPSFTRERATVFSISKSLSKFNGSFNDYGRDLDNNGLYDELRIDIGVDIDVAGKYCFSGNLEDATGNLIQFSSIENELFAGTHTVTLVFDGAKIYCNQQNGSFKLVDLTLTEIHDDGLLLVDILKSAYETKEYQFNLFERPDIILSGQNDDYGIDTNNNGLFDILHVNLGLDLRYSDNYHWSAKLFDKNGKELDIGAQSGYLNAGSAVISLEFDGEKIGKNGVDGPYFVKDLLVYGSGGANIVAVNAAQTNAYLFTQFEGSILPFEELKTIASKIVFNGGDDEFYVYQKFVLNKNTDAFDLFNEPVTVTVGSYNATIPAASFSSVQTWDKFIATDDTLIWAYLSGKDEGLIAMSIVLIDSSYGLAGYYANHVDMQLTLLNNAPDACPIKVEIGNDVGEETAIFEERVDRWVIMGPPLPRHDLQSQNTIPAPHNLILFQNYPNPFNPQTQIAFSLPEKCQVTINVYDLTGRLVKKLYEAQTDPGKHQVVWKGLDASGQAVASGIYIYRLTAISEKGKQHTFYNKMMLLR